jgi:formate dehydrogenase major subunit/formate dehydrogenase alpha subunit
VRSLPSAAGLTLAELPAAIESGRVKAMVIENSIAGRFTAVNQELMEALPRLEFLAVFDSYADTPLGKLAHAILPTAMYPEKDGTFTSYDRTVQRLRTAVPPMGEARTITDVLSRLSRQMGYAMTYRNSAHVMDEIARLVPGYGGITYARLERNGVNAPTMSYSDAGTPILAPGSILNPQLVSTNGSR